MQQKSLEHLDVCIMDLDDVWYSYTAPCVGRLNLGWFCSVKSVTFVGWV